MIGKTISHYKIIEEIGRGGMGTVYRAVHVRLEREVALKVLPKGRNTDQRAVARFEREMAAVADDQAGQRGGTGVVSRGRVSLAGEPSIDHGVGRCAGDGLGRSRPGAGAGPGRYGYAFQ